MRSIISGTAGFIGSRLTRKLLEYGHEIIGIDNFSLGFENKIQELKKDFPNTFFFFETDIRNLNTANPVFHSLIKSKEIEIVYHLAAQTELTYCQNHPTEVVDININGTLNMLQLAKDVKCKRFVFMDTSAEYDSAFEFPTQEYTAPNCETPMGFYAITKMAASQFVRAWTYENRIGSTLFRPFNVCGPGQNIIRDVPPVMGAFANKILNKEAPIIFGDGSKRRDYIHVDDMIELLIYARENGDVYSHTFNAGTGKAYSVLEIYEFVSEYIFGDNRHLWINPIYKENKPHEAQLTLADMTKTENHFNWKPKKTIHDMVKDTVESLRKR